MMICVYGAASENIADIYKTETEKFGRELVKHGHSLIFGAGSTGLMGAVSRGAHEEGGEVIGVTPHFMHDFEPICSNCTRIIHTETMGERKAVMEDNAEAFVIVPGGVGTFDEFFQIVTLRELGRNSAPIVLFNIDHYYDEILVAVDAGIKKGFIRPVVRELFTVCETVDQIFEALD